MDNPDLHKEFIEYMQKRQRSYEEGQLRLAHMFETGNGVEQNSAKATDIYFKLAKDGCKEAMDALKNYNPDGGENI